MTPSMVPPRVIRHARKKYIYESSELNNVIISPDVPYNIPLPYLCLKNGSNVSIPYVSN